MPVVRVSWFKGKNHDQKAKVAAEITESIFRNTGTDPKYIYVIFDDVKPSDWAGEGKTFRRSVHRNGLAPSLADRRRMPIE